MGQRSSSSRSSSDNYNRCVEAGHAQRICEKVKDASDVADHLSGVSAGETNVGIFKFGSTRSSSGLRYLQEANMRKHLRELEEIAWRDNRE